MNTPKHFEKLSLALELLDQNRLFIYDSVDDFKKPLAAFDIALTADIRLENLDRNYQLPLQYLKTLAETCYNCRQKMNELNPPSNSHILKLLDSCIAQVERIYDKCYGLRSSQIEKMQYEEKVYDFLITIGVYQSDKRHLGALGFTDWDEDNERKKKEDAAKKRDLVDFAKNNLEDVVHTIYSWARGNNQYNARIQQNEHAVIAVHNIIQASKTPNTIMSNA